MIARQTVIRSFPVLAAIVLLLAGALVPGAPVRAASQLSLDWSIPERYSDANGDGFTEQVYAPDGSAAIDPGGWRVDLIVSGANCGGTGARTWWIEGEKLHATMTRSFDP